jgi:glycosyltransferase involved in cell wall biosynthesis
MKIAVLGIRGYPSSYGGYETFIGELVPRLINKGHEVTVYCRKQLYDQRPKQYEGVNLIYISSIEHKIFSTLSHSFFSILHASFHKYDIVLVANAGNGIFGFIPKIFGRKAVLNVDGMEWLRPKWNTFAKRFFKFSARLGTKFYDAIVTDAEEMHRLYAQTFGINSTYIAYGANIESSTNPEILKQYGLEPNNYYLIASRLVPDNNADIIIKGFVQSDTKKYLAIAGGADYKGNTTEQNFIRNIKSIANDRVKFLGHISNQRHIIELHCNAFAYLHGHQFGGINPALLKALGCGNVVLANNTPFNAEVLKNGEIGLLFEKNWESVAQKINFIENNRPLYEEFKIKAKQRIIDDFSWEKITNQYEELFMKIIKS